MRRARVLVAGAGGATLGTECVKSIVAAGRHDVVVADISPLAFGFYVDGPVSRVLLRQDRYVDDLLDQCRKLGVAVVVPGSEATTHLVASARARLAGAGVACAVNGDDVMSTCADKVACFEHLASLAVPTPRTWALSRAADVESVVVPCVVKPSTGSGGSMMVGIARSREDVLSRAMSIWASGRGAMAQEYLPADEGEFTVGVLCLGDWVGSVAMRREFPSKLSYVFRDGGFLVSSGYSQGLIDDFPEVCAQSERIARLLGSRGPLNVQGRMRDGQFVPFEINPRLSATTYLRHLAGFEEVGMLIDHLLHGRTPPVPPRIRSGFYLRSLAETFVAAERVFGH